LRYVFNKPRRHTWHYSKVEVKDHSHRMNFGLSLSVWDYIFGTAYVPKGTKTMSSVLKRREISSRFLESIQKALFDE
jgi:sterol desaturase/sphingolipid hydroxylase (fatty acid hydroxylase superfamily)